MIDGFALSQMFARPPDQHFLVEKGWRLFYKPSGEFSRLAWIEGRKPNEPKLTIYPTPKGCWFLNASVTLTSWLEGSNVRLIKCTSEFQRRLKLFSEFATERSGIIFNAEGAKVKKVEFTNDFVLEQNRILEIISNLKKSEINKYLLKPYKTSVNFHNDGKTQNQLIKVYSKYHECLDKKEDKAIVEKAKNIMRFEVELRNKAIYNLAKSLNLPNHKAKYILTKEVSDFVIERKMKLIKLDKYLNNDVQDILNLFRTYPKPYADKLSNFLALESKFGKKLYEIPELQLTKRTCQKYKRDCNNAGVLSFG